jgi:hypothetical protein
MRKVELMKRFVKTILPAVALVTVVFVVRGSGHVPRQLLLISDETEISSSASQVMPVIPIPGPIVLAVDEERLVSALPDEHPPIIMNPTLPPVGDRSPPFSPA